jgi:hypothetical protein
MDQFGLGMVLAVKSPMKGYTFLFVVNRREIGLGY